MKTTPEDPSQRAVEAGAIEAKSASADAAEALKPSSGTVNGLDGPLEALQHPSALSIKAQSTE